MQDASFQEETLDLEAGDICVMVTDGITEALEPGARAPVDAIAERVPGSRWLGNGRLQRGDVARASGERASGVERWEDDRTVVVVAVSGRSAAPPERLPSMLRVTRSVARSRVDEIDASHGRSPSWSWL